MQADLPPATVDEFHARLAASVESLPKRLRQCADYIAANSDRIAVSTVADLAAGADVPPSALMRFCQIIGFSGFSEMQKLFRDAYSPSLPDYGTRLENLKSGGAGSPARLLGEFIESGRLSLESLAKSVDEAALEQAVDLLAHAGTLHIVGYRRDFSVASYLSYVIEKLQDNGFNVRYTHPNLLLISWNHWVPQYVRTEIKKKTGKNIDGYGNIITEKNDDNSSSNTKLNLLKYKDSNKDSNKDTKPITAYKPTGKIVYNDILESLKN
jgi:hypothetical protein